MLNALPMLSVIPLAALVTYGLHLYAVSPDKPRRQRRTFGLVAVVTFAYLGYRHAVARLFQ